MREKTLTNIDCFNHCAVLILSRLYAEFPRPVHLFPLDEEGILVKNSLLSEECQYEQSGDLYRYSFQYLMDEGVVRGSYDKVGVFQNAVLTSKGFTIMNKPLLEEEFTTIGDRLREAASMAGKSIWNEAVPEVIQSVFSWLK